jgi:hypothetical protein
MGSAMAYTLMASSLAVTFVCRFLFQKAIGA